MRAQEEQKWRDEVTALVVLGALAGLVVLALKYPAQALQVLNCIERTFGLTADTDADSHNRDASKTTESAPGGDAPPYGNRRRKDTVSQPSTEPLSRDAVVPECGHA
jgi:hypothetical protein